MSSVPKLRFKEFSGEWQVKKLGELAKIGTGKKDTQDKIEDGEYPFFVRSQTIERINSYSFDGEAILTAGDGVGVGKVFHYINGKFDYHQRVYRLSDFKKGTNGRYLYEYFRKNFIREVTKYTAKTSVDSVRMEMITKMDIPHPLIEEQEKIASFFSLIDDKISLQSEKVDALKDYKKGMMQKIFSRELRFKDDDGRDYPEWEEKKLGNYLIEYKEKTSENNQYPPLTSSRKGLFLQSDYFDKQIASTDNIGYNIVPRNYFTYRHMSDDAMFFFNINNLVDNGIVSTLYPVFTTNNKLDSIFLRYYLNETNEFKKYSLLQKQGGSRTYMYLSKLKEFKIKLPIIEEQNKIVKLLVDLENKLNKEQNKLDSLNEYKKGLLQQMFV